MPPKIILGIDPGLATTGYGIIRVTGHDLAMIDYGCLLTNPKEKFIDRLEIIHAELQKIIKKYQPNLIAVEELFFAKNVKTAIHVAHARGVILLTACESKTPTIEFTPLQVKQAVTSYGQADKKQVQEMVKVFLNLKECPKPDDAADALAIAICAANCRITN